MEHVPNVKELVTNTENDLLIATNANNSSTLEMITDTTSVQSVPEQFVFSYSEAQTWRACQMKHYYTHIQRLAPKHKSQPLQIGIAGHDLLATYYKARDETSQKEAISALKTRFVELATEAGTNDSLIKAYELSMNFVLNDPFLAFEVICVEERFDYDLTDEITLAMTTDLVLKKDDRCYVVDHKFVGRPWDTTKLMFATQLDIYAYILQHHGYPIAQKIYNFIPTRTGVPKQEWFTLNMPKIDRVLSELTFIAEDIAYKEALLADVKPMIPRSLEPSICQWCAFSDLCYAELTGNETNAMRAKLTMTENDYGYRKGPNGDQ